MVQMKVTLLMGFAASRQIIKMESSLADERGKGSKIYKKAV
jgi:hypothetical protein